MHCIFTSVLLLTMTVCGCLAQRKDMQLISNKGMYEEPIYNQIKPCLSLNPLYEVPRPLLGEEYDPHYPDMPCFQPIRQPMPAKIPYFFVEVKAIPTKKGSQPTDGSKYLTENQLNKVCGFQSTSFAPQTRIKRVSLTGTESRLGQWPWMAGLTLVCDEHHNVSRCGGVLISEWYILTAASCNHNGEKDIDAEKSAARLGTLTFGDQTKRYPVSEFIPHPSYAESKGLLKMQHDLALVKLRNKLPGFGNNIKPICLPKQAEKDNEYVKMNGYVGGWGAHVDRTAWGRLKHVSQRVNKCTWKRIICAGNKTHAPCIGDTGGSLMVQGLTRRWYTLGILFSSVQKCNRQGLYINTGEHVNWIKSTAHIVSESKQLQL